MPCCPWLYVWVLLVFVEENYMKHLVAQLSARLWIVIFNVLDKRKEVIVKCDCKWDIANAIEEHLQTSWSDQSCSLIKNRLVTCQWWLKVDKSKLVKIFKSQPGSSAILGHCQFTDHQIWRLTRFYILRQFKNLSRILLSVGCHSRQEWNLQMIRFQQSFSFVFVFVFAALSFTAAVGGCGCAGGCPMTTFNCSLLFSSNLSFLF